VACGEKTVATLDVGHWRLRQRTPIQAEKSTPISTPASSTQWRQAQVVKSTTKTHEVSDLEETTTRGILSNQSLVSRKTNDGCITGCRNHKWIKKTMSSNKRLLLSVIRAAFQEISSLATFADVRTLQQTTFRQNKPKYCLQHGSSWSHQNVTHFKSSTQRWTGLNAWNRSKMTLIYHSCLGLVKSQHLKHSERVRFSHELTKVIHVYSDRKQFSCKASQIGNTDFRKTGITEGASVPERTGQVTQWLAEQRLDDYRNKVSLKS